MSPGVQPFEGKWRSVFKTIKSQASRSHLNSKLQFVLSAWPGLLCTSPVWHGLALRAWL